ncbi:MAG: ABC transporter permease [Anaerolineales bacterium]
MKKIFNIAWKDLLITLGDPAALILTIATPFALTLVMIFAFGNVNDSGISGIPVAIVNLDESDFGQNLVEVFKSEDLADLVAPTEIDDPTAAKAAVDNDEFAAAVIIPANLGEGMSTSDPDQSFSQSDLSDWGNTGEQAVIEIYGNPTRPTSVNVVRTIVDEFINRASAMISGIQVSVGQMLQSGRLSTADPKSAFIDVGEFAVQNQVRYIALQGSMAEGSVDAEFDWFGYIAPSMALLFLMFTITNGGRSILTEREEGTLPRMLTTPSNAPQVLGGKVFGIYINGVSQLAVLFLASMLMLHINWGPINVVVPTILFVVAAATGWGMLIAAFAQTPAQASIMGTAITLVFAIGSGSFFPRQFLPEWLQKISLISPNAWGIEAFNSIRLGATVSELLPLWIGMLMMFAILFVISTFIFRRQYR